ncbi:GDSL esterase/lipase 5-like isoform X1 [Actinidia eriantha]|uniref:GDSL esterase/lipase 5-like isoform X1 n=1 Tax=Actinidia eriantha TaxID=165200 RepID=UPI00259018F7|nr:GDSL esterase/lipase 5-like isoform X1 [Actinidia eriantha]
MARSSSSSSSFILILFMLFTPIFSLRECQQRRLEGGGKVALYIFGDSLFDSGNNNYIHTTPLDQANFWPYGETFFNFPTGRFSDGRLMSDFIAEYAKLPLIRAYLEPGIEQDYENGVNFASAGAGALVETFQGAVINLSTQLRNYKKVVRWLRGKLGDGEADTSLSRAVYLFSIGSNDYMSPFLTNSSVLTSYSNSNYVAMVIGNLTMAIKEVYLRGGRKFGFLNLGPLGCLPGLRMIQQEANGSCLEEKASTLAMLHNEALSKLLSNLETQLKGLIYALYDFNTNLGQRMNHPSKYGFKEGKSACCGTGRFRGTFSCGGKRPVKEFELCESPNEYVFWDTFHLTEKFYKQMADQMWAGGPPAVKPYNLKSLFQCLD